MRATCNWNNNNKERRRYVYSSYFVVTTLTVVTLTWYLHCDDLTSIVPTLRWHGYLHGKYTNDLTNIVVHTLCWHDYHGTYTEVTWWPSWYLHWGDMTTNMVPTLWWHNYHGGTFIVVTWLLTWNLHYGGMTTIMGPAPLWWQDNQHATYTTMLKLKDGVWRVGQSLSLRSVCPAREFIMKN